MTAFESTRGGETEALVVETHLDATDWAALQRAWSQRMRARVGRARLLTATLLPLLAGVSLAWASGAGTAALPSFVIGLVSLMGATAWSASLFRRFSVPEADGLVLGRVRIVLSADGVSLARDRAASHTRWPAVREVTRTAEHLFLWVDTASAYIVPLRDLPAGVDAAAALARARAWAGRLEVTTLAPDERAPSPVGADAPVPPRPALLATLARRLSWRQPAAAADPADVVVLACAALALAVWLGFDRWAAGAGAQWYPGGLAGLSWYASGVLALAWVLHRATAGAAGFGSLLAAVVGALPLALALGLAARTWAPPWAYGLVVTSLAVAFVVHVRRTLEATTGSRQPRAIVAGALLALLFAWATSRAWVYPHLWYASEDDDDDGRPWADSERLLFEQPDRIDAAAARLGGGRPGRADVFFLGFAGVGEQKVFAEELKLAERVVTERYGAHGRSLLLINDRRDRETHSLATVHGLKRALRRIGERMDPAEDVLFLMLTSHGSRAPSLSVSNTTWPLESLDGQALREALDASGIRWRVIVISACHSGAFIPALADERTIVLTSAAGERASFGCSDDREVTEFGAAFIRDALPRAPSLLGAFERAKREIAGRERREKLDASLPQRHVGRAIADYWTRVEGGRP